MDGGTDSGDDNLQVCLLGLGEAGAQLAGDLVRAGARVSAYDPARVETPDGVARRVHPSLAVRPADVIVGATGGADARLAMFQAIDAIEPGTLYADVSTAAPGMKLALADEAVHREFDFVDVAILGMVSGNGLGAPALASGLGADRLADMFNPLGAQLEPIEGPPGTATAKSLLRSVVIKGFGSVLIEAVRAAAAADDLDWLWGNLADEIEGADEDWMRSLVLRSQRHAGRKSDEMDAAQSVLEGLGVEPVMTSSTAASLRRLAEGAGLPHLPPVVE